MISPFSPLDNLDPADQRNLTSVPAQSDDRVPAEVCIARRESLREGSCRARRIPEIGAQEVRVVVELLVRLLLQDALGPTRTREALP